MGLGVMGFIAIALVFATYRIVETSRWLQEHRTYIRQRDARWDPFLLSIEAHLARQDKDIVRIRESLDRILAHVEQHERLMIEQREARPRPQPPGATP